jgi:hypothetical protein
VANQQDAEKYDVLIKIGVKTKRRDDCRSPLSARSMTGTGVIFSLTEIPVSSISHHSLSLFSRKQESKDVESAVLALGPPLSPE